MCYLVAKDRNAHGCFALKTTHGKHLVELKKELNREVGYKGVQLVTISRPTAYGEYAPYHFVDGECMTAFAECSAVKHGKAAAFGQNTHISVHQRQMFVKLLSILRPCNVHGFCL